MLRIWGRPNSSNVQKPLWLCTELAIPFERIDAGGAHGRTRDPDYLAMNPNALVPTIEDGGFVLWESNTIVRYLAAKHGAHDWYPSGLHARALVEQWMDWSSTVFAPAMTAAFWGLVRTPEAERDTGAIRASGERSSEALAILDRQLEGRDHVCGSAPTLADIALGINTYRWFNLPWDAAGYRRPELPALAAWYRRLAARPAYRQVVMTPIS